MKNLMIFESFEDNYHIKDIFQEVIDEFGLYKWKPSDKMGTTGVFNIYRDIGNNGGVTMKFWVIMKDISDIRDIEKYIEVNIIPRLKSMGYHTSSESKKLYYNPVVEYYGLEIYL